VYGDDCGLRILGVKSAGEGDVCIPILSQKNVNRIVEFLDRFEPDIVHAHEPVSLAFVGQIWATIRGVPFVYTPHVLPSRFIDFGASDLIQMLKWPLTETVARQFLNTFHQGCDAIVALNRYAAADIRQFGYEGRILNIPNGRDLAKYRACQTADPVSREKVLTFVGFVSPRKNQLFLLQALKHLSSGYRLQIVGRVLKSSYAQELEDFCRMNNLRNVVFTGQVAHEQIPAYLQQTHVFVSASKMEVQSLAILEALASGTPVVGLSNETVDELVDDRVGCRLEGDSSPQAFAQCVEALCELPPSEYALMCWRARQRVERFDWANVVRLMAEEYGSLVAEKPPVLDESHIRILDVIARIPSDDVRQALAERVIALDKAMRQLRPDHKWHLAREATRISTPTWFYVVLTMLASLVGYLLLRARRAPKKRQTRVSQTGVARQPLERTFFGEARGRLVRLGDALRKE
jgi:glycosyltransferase involved in cell wall biosynthesis